MKLHELVIDFSFFLFYNFEYNYSFRLNGDFLEHYFTNNETLKSELRTIKYQYGVDAFVFMSDNGVFSKDKIDFGSRLLVETILEEERDVGTVLDVGCGYGFMGIVLSKLFSCQGTLIDVNKRAVHLANRNCKELHVDAEAIVSDVYENVSGTFDLVVTNPPIRAGKKVVLQILSEAKQFLNPKGRLWFVIRKDQGAKSIMKLLETMYKLEVVKKEKGFYIIRANRS